MFSILPGSPTVLVQTAVVHTLQTGKQYPAKVMTPGSGNSNSVLDAIVHKTGSAIKIKNTQKIPVQSPAISCIHSTKDFKIEPIHHRMQSHRIFPA